VGLEQWRGDGIACDCMDDPEGLEKGRPSRCVVVLTGNPDRH